MQQPKAPEKFSKHDLDVHLLFLMEYGEWHPTAYQHPVINTDGGTYSLEKSIQIFSHLWRWRYVDGYPNDFKLTLEGLNVARLGGIEAVDTMRREDKEKSDNQYQSALITNSTSRAAARISLKLAKSTKWTNWFIMGTAIVAATSLLLQGLNTSLLSDQVSEQKEQNRIQRQSLQDQSELKELSHSISALKTSIDSQNAQTSKLRLIVDSLSRPKSK